MPNYPTCVDCVHRQTSLLGKQFSRCVVSRVKSYDLTGLEPVPPPMFCNTARREGNPCGPEGKLYKQEESLWEFIKKTAKLQWSRI